MTKITYFTVIGGILLVLVTALVVRIGIEEGIPKDESEESEEGQESIEEAQELDEAALQKIAEQKGIDSLLEYGQKLYERKDCEGAIEVFQYFIAHYPEHESTSFVQLLILDCYRQQDNWRKFIKEGQKIVVQMGDDEMGHGQSVQFGIAEAYARLGKLNEAKESYKKVIENYSEHYPTPQTITLLKKEAAERLKLAETASVCLLNSYVEAWYYSNGRSDPWYIGLPLVGDYSSTPKEKLCQKVISIFEKLMEEYPDNALADKMLFFEGRCYRDLHDYNKAVQLFQKVIQRYPTSDYAKEAEKIIYIIKKTTE